MNSVWIVKDFRAYMIIYRLSRKQKIMPGESMQNQFEAVYKKHPDYFKYLGETQQDKDLLLGNMREKGIKVFDIDEAERRKIYL